MRLIDADELLDYLDAKRKSHCTDCTDIECDFCYDRWIEEIPTADSDPSYMRRLNDALAEENNELIDLYENEKKVCHKWQAEVEAYQLTCEQLRREIHQLGEMLDNKE